MRNDKHIAVKLRRKGQSYNRISKELGIGKSTLSDWFSEIDWSKEIKAELTRKANYISKKRLRLINKRRKEKWEQWREDARQQARRDFFKLQHNPLFIAGLMIYWGEGDSKMENGNVRVSNTNSDMLRIYYLFLRKICYAPEEKIRAAMILYPDLKERKCKRYWSSSIGIPESHFTKTQFIKGKHPTKRLTYGIGIISLSSRALKEKIFVWIDLFHRKYPRAGVAQW